MSRDYKFPIEFIVNATGGTVISSPNRHFKTYSTDNRQSDIAESLFIPLIGGAHDAHEYVKAAVEAGATGVLFHQWNPQWEGLKTEASFIEVKDTLGALQDLALAWRKQMSGKVIALTGSNGKTTTKDFLFQILSQFGKTNASRGSYNNHWGVPFTLLDSEADTDYCITEMGMNHAGEIKTLCQIAKPDVVTVTNVGRAHMGNFTNGVEGIAQAKREIYDSAEAATQLIFNIDNQWTRRMYADFADYPSYTFSNKNFSTDVYLKIKAKNSQGFDIEGQIGGVIGATKVSFWGEHNIENLTAAVSLAYIAGVSANKLWKALEVCNTGWGRNQWVELSNQGRLLFDGYNANPDSFLQLLNNIESTWDESKQYVAIFGEMLELGEQAALEHEELGKKAGELNWAHCLFIGSSGRDFLRGWELAKNKNKPIILDTYKESLDLDLQSMVNDQSLVIVKGSRGGALERVVERLGPVKFSSKK